MKFTEKTTLAEILGFGGAEEVLAKHNVPCLSCPMVKSEMEWLTIGQICVTYGIDSAVLLKDLNSLAQKFSGESKSGKT